MNDNAATHVTSEHPSRGACVAGPPLMMQGMIWPANYPAVQAARVPDRPALIFKAQATSYRELESASTAFATLLRHQGLQPGERIACLGRNSDAFFPILFGSMRARTVLVPANWRNSAVELRYLLEDSQARLIIVEREFEAVLNEADPTRSVRILWIDELVAHGFGADETTDSSDPDGDIDPEIPCLQLYTSGTTGRPKGVLINQRMIAVGRAAELQSTAYKDWQDDEIVLSAMPNFHVGGLCWVLGALVRGLTCVITAELSPSTLTQLIIDHAITRSWLVPMVVRMLVDEFRNRGQHLSTLRGVHYGGAPMDVNLLQDALATLGCRFLQYYGMTEISGCATVLGPDDHDLERPHLLRSVGKPVAGLMVKICGPDKVQLEIGESGEIWLKGPSLMLGYWHNPAATADVMEDGWYRTGDGGRVSEGGFLYLTDRIKEMIVSGGENIYPVEVETVLRQHPAVYEVAVFGVPDARWGEKVVAAIELRPDHSATPEEIVHFSRRSLAGYKVPKLVDLDIILPRTASGKIQRNVARQIFLAKSSDPS